MNNFPEQLKLFNLQELAITLAEEVRNKIEQAKTRDKKMFGYNCYKVFEEHNINHKIRYELMAEIGKRLDIDPASYEVAENKKEEKINSKINAENAMPRSLGENRDIIRDARNLEAIERRKGNPAYNEND